MNLLATGFLRTCLIGLKYLRTCKEYHLELKNLLPVPAFRLLSWTNLSTGGHLELPMWVSAV